MKQYKINDIVTVEEIVRAECTCKNEKEFEDKCWEFEHNKNFRIFVLNGFKRNHNIFSMVEQRDGSFKVKELMRKPMEEFINEMADIEARKQDAIMAKEYTKEELFIEMLRMQGMAIPKDLLQALKPLCRVYDITYNQKTDKYTLSKK